MIMAGILINGLKLYRYRRAHGMSNDLAIVLETH
jgi:hypothetical protein